MPAARASRGEAKARPAAVEPKLALVVGMHAGDDLHQRALAGAVLADEPMDLAGGSAKSTSLSAATPPKDFVIPVSSRKAASAALAASAAQIRK